MRKLFGIVMISVLLLSLTSGVLAEPKPQNVPHQIMADDPAFAAAFQGTTFGGLWKNMAGAAELPQADDAVRGPVSIGFTFQFFDGPVEPVAGWPPADWKDWWCGDTAPPLPEDWPSELSGMGYDKVWVSTNGYVVMADPQYLAKVEEEKVSIAEYVIQDPNISSSHYDPALGPQLPNNYIAPFWSDWVIGDNTTWKVDKICKNYMGDVWDEVNEEWDPWYEWVPCQWSEVFRPRGRILAHTFGDAPNRVFVVEWQNARNYDSGDLISFQLQLFEGSNAILFLYSDPMPAVDGRPFFQPNGVIGMEDSFGKTYVGEFFSAGEWKAGADWWTNAAAPVADQDMMGFVY